LHGRRNTPVKERILLGRIIPSLRTVDTIVTKIEAETTTEIATETTETTETLVAIGHTDNLIATADPRDVATSARKRIAGHGSIQTRNGQERKRPTKASSMTAQTDASTIALRNGSSNTSLSARKEVTKIQRRRQMTPLKA
jgi:hypothetical protein